MQSFTLKPASIRRTLSLLVVAHGLASAASAAEFIVGPGHHETLQAAVDAAAAVGNNDAQNIILIRAPVLLTSARVRIGAEFGEARQLLIRPDSSVPGLARVTIVSQNGLQEIVLIEGAGHVTLQDLDLVRHATNSENLVEILNSTEIIVERCRVGSDWPTASAGNRSNLVIGSPRDVVVRNCIFFAHLPGNLARGIEVSMGSGANHSLFLYNNVVADHALHGLEITAHDDTFVLLRNNVVFNHISLTPEPTAYHSFVDADVDIVTSHNTALAAAARVEQVEAGAQSIAGVDNFLRLERHKYVQTFREFEWKTDLGWNQNRNLFRLLEGGLMNNTDADAGVAVADGDPDARDVAVLDDWEMDPRPNGDSRTDRGADQVRELTVDEVHVILPGIPSFVGVSVGGTGTSEFEVVAVGPQTDLPEVPEAMSGGEYSMTGHFTSLVSVTGTPPMLPNSTSFDGSPLGFIEWPSAARYDTNLAMTVEAWVFREDPQRFETILSHNRTNSFWFGLAGTRLRFHRSGGGYADSVGTVGGHRWTHLAAAYDGSQVEFYIDGESAGVNLLANAGAGRAEPLAIGGDRSGANFRGMLDEVRLWNVRRLDSEIRETMLVPITPRPGLAALFPSGGAWEAIAGIPGQAGPGAVGRPIGVVRQNLEIPNGLLSMSLDGAIQSWSEYLGGTQVPIRYDARDQAPDAIASLVYRARAGDQNLYIGITGLRDVPLGRERSNSWVAVTFDADWSRDAAPTFGDFEVRGYLDGRRPELWSADGLGGWLNLGILPGGTWDVVYAFPNEFGPPQMEFRIGRAWLTPLPEAADWNGTDGLMIGHYHVEANGDNYLAPVGLHRDSPATWAPANYILNTNVLTRVIMAGLVFDTDSAHPLVGHRVDLQDELTHEVLASRTTDSAGRFSFNPTYVPPNRPLGLSLASCDHCLYLPPRVSTNNLQPTFVSPQWVVFPPPMPESYSYARVSFFLRQPIGPISLTGFTPSSAAPELILRDDPLKKLQGETVRIEGTNLHSQIQVFLYDCPDLPPQDRSDCRFGFEIIEVPSTNIVVGAGGTWIDVTVPHVPQESWGRGWGWAVKDNWARPGQVAWNAIGGLFGGDPFRLKLPVYPRVHGFSFDNEDDSATLQDFDGVFGNNAYICLGAFGECICRVRDPLYMIYYGIYDAWITTADGSCNGMASTSLLFAQESLTPSSFEAGVHFPAGFTGIAPEDADDPPRPPKPPTYRDGEACVPFRPRNLWAHIRVNHGVQASAEAIQVCLDQIDGGIFSTSGNPHDALNRVRRDPWQTVISLVPSVGSGHVVTPYEVTDGMRIDRNDGTNIVTLDPDYSVIWVYDNNRPENTNRFIQIMPVNREHPHGQYRFEYGRDDTWRGEGIFVIPLSIWYGERTAPGVLTALEAIVVLVVGAADALYSGADGGQWGWQPDGTFVDNLKGAKSITPLGGENTTTRSVMLALPATNPPPNVRINARGSHYYFHAAQGGRMLQLEQHDGVAGDQEQMQIGYEAGRLASMRFSPERPATNFNARVGMQLGVRQSAVFDCSGLSVPSGRAVEFKALDMARGIEVRNDTGEVLHPTLTVTWVDGPSANYGTNRFVLPEVPAGAVQHAVVHDWPVASQVRSEIDINGDGVPDRTEIVTGVAVTPPSTLALTFQLDATGQNLRLTWPAIGSNPILESTTELGSPGSWTIVTTPRDTVGQFIHVTVPAVAADQFFRLRQ